MERLMLRSSPHYGLTTLYTVQCAVYTMYLAPIFENSAIFQSEEEGVCRHCIQLQAVSIKNCFNLHLRLLVHPCISVTARYEVRMGASVS